MANPVRLLIVEDNPGDVRLVREIFRELTTPVDFHVANDGEEALCFLQNASQSIPDLILLDLNLPRKNGLELLKEIKGNAAWKTIPVIVLTSSQAEQDVITSYNLHANAYIVKSIDLEQLTQVVQALEAFWLKVARLPLPNP